MTKPSGWYDDPQDLSQLRYWDGVVWSSNVTPKASPTVGESNIGMPFAVPSAALPQAPGSPAQGSPMAPDGYHPSGQGQSGQQDQGHQDQGPWPAYGQAPGPPGQFGQQPLGWASQSATTPDGVMLSGWWKRVLAQIIDDIIVWIVALPLTFVPLMRAATIFSDYWKEVWAAVEAGSSATPQISAEFDGPMLQVGLTVLAVHVMYEIAFLTRTGATIGKMIVGISVRLRDRPGPPPLLAVLKRTAVKKGGDLGGSLVLGIYVWLFSLFSLLNVLWPLWDDKKQALHDKAGATNVVVGRQPRRDG